MKVDTMRRIDRRAGVPLCAVATVLLRLRDWLRGRSVRPVRRILFVELSEMGTTVLAEPAMRKARERSSAELFFVVFARNVGSIELLGAFPSTNVFTISDASFFGLARDTLVFLRWTRQMQIDTVVDLELFSRFTALLTGLCGADRRIGFHRFHNEGLYRGEMLTHRVAYNPHIHIAKNFIALVDALLAPAPTVPYSKTLIGDDQIKAEIAPVTAPARAQMLARIRALVPFDPATQRLVLVNPNASEFLPHRRWMPDRFAQLIRRILAAYDDVVVLITGASGEREEAERLAAANGRALRIIRGAFGARRFAGALRACRLDGDQRFRPGALFRGSRTADDRAVRPGDAETLPAVGEFDAQSMPGSPARPA